MRSTILLTSILCSACAAENFGTAEERVIGGELTPAGKFPYAGALISEGGLDPVPTEACSGTLIAPNVVLTAAHCIAPEAVGPDIPGFTLKLDTLQITDAEIVLADKAIVHPSFKLFSTPDPGLTQWYDIGLLILQKPIDGVPVASLPHAVAIAVDEEVAIVGYGRFGQGDIAGVKHDATTKVAEVGDHELWIAHPGEPQDCIGDSGGPALVGDVVVGVVSRGQGAGAETCDQGGIDTRVEPYVDWIRAEANIPCASDCGQPAGTSTGGDTPSPKAGGCSTTGGGGGASPIGVLVALWMARRAARRGIGPPRTTRS